MKPLLATLIAVVLATLATGPIQAGGGPREDDLVTKTFTLTLYGNVPRDRTFGLVYATPEQQDNPVAIVFCGPDVPNSGRPIVGRIAGGDCEGDGTRYTARVTVPRGTKLAYAYVHVFVSADDHGGYQFVQSFDGDEPDGDEDWETLDSETTTAAYFDFVTEQCGRGEVPDAAVGARCGE